MVMVLATLTDDNMASVPASNKSPRGIRAFLKRQRSILKRKALQVATDQHHQPNKEQYEVESVVLASLLKRTGSLATLGDDNCSKDSRQQQQQQKQSLLDRAGSLRSLPSLWKPNAPLLEDDDLDDADEGLAQHFPRRRGGLRDMVFRRTESLRSLHSTNSTTRKNKRRQQQNTTIFEEPQAATFFGHGGVVVEEQDCATSSSSPASSWEGDATASAKRQGTMSRLFISSVKAFIRRRSERRQQAKMDLQRVKWELLESSRVLQEAMVTAAKRQGEQQLTPFSQEFQVGKYSHNGSPLNQHAAHFTVEMNGGGSNGAEIVVEEACDDSSHSGSNDFQEVIMEEVDVDSLMVGPIGARAEPTANNDDDDDDEEDWVSEDENDNEFNAPEEFALGFNNEGKRESDYFDTTPTDFAFVGGSMLLRNDSLMAVAEEFEDCITSDDDKSDATTEFEYPDDKDQEEGEFQLTLGIGGGFLSSLQESLNESSCSSDMGDDHVSPVLTCF